MELLQERLNVTIKKRSNLFNWRGQFTPDFVAYMLESFAEPGSFVIDPFSGSGTVLQEAILHENPAEGFEINPSAYAMSKFFTFANLEVLERWDMLHRFEVKLNIVLRPLNGQLIYKENPDYRIAYKSLLDVGRTLIPTLNKAERILWLNLLFLSERDKNATLKHSFQKSFLYLKNALIKLPFSNQSIRASLQDAREVGKSHHEDTDLILTSPPYINVFNYHQNYRALVELFDFDLLKVANSEFGSNRKNRGNRFKTVVQYCLDMEQAVRSFWNALKYDATLLMVLGRQSNVRGTAFYNGEIVAEIIKSTKGFEEVGTMERKFTNKFGAAIKEDILIFRKKGLMVSSEAGREVAANHLKRNLDVAENDIKSDLIDALDSIDTIISSPVFDYKKIMNNA